MSSKCDMAEDLTLHTSPFEQAPRLPPEDVRVTDYRVMPWPDGTRVTVEIGLTPFRTFPAIDISIVTPEGEVLRQSSYVGAMERRPSPTLHLPRLEASAPLVAVIEMLHGDTVTQEVRAPFTVGGPIVKQTVGHG
jgi:hypothetical protein